MPKPRMSSHNNRTTKNTEAIWEKHLERPSKSRKTSPPNNYKVFTTNLKRQKYALEAEGKGLIMPSNKPGTREVKP